MPPMSFTGVVTKVGAMQKTATVTVSRWVVHERTRKRMQRSKKFLVHDEKDQLRINDSVVIRNCPPISARKRFTLEHILRSPETEHDELLRRLAEAREEQGQGQGQGQGGVLEALRLEGSSGEGTRVAA
ncbi:nucleic acid-binding protein [Cristinia sonorae]|uniref:Nucleic acid-binding protein n=1 Tax=Cristinia sonorae TaxID=1940300 RepID=A0A8K0UIB8_9AGAR|nr:nucleic acid-binding protein [Cristinia sonorae]